MHDNFPLFPESASTVAGQVDALTISWVLISIFFSVLIFALVIVFAVWFRRKHEDQVGTPETASTALEITWSVIPLVIVMFFFVWGAKVFITISRPPADAVEYYVVGKQWMWKVQHPAGNREINTLHVPVGVPIKLVMTSEDTIHSFFVPAFRVKQDVLPGRYTTVWFEATKIGTYHIFCAEYCGAEHSLMIGSVHVMAPDAYQAWLDGREDSRPLFASGKELFETLACHTCHRDEDSDRGPRLAEMAGEEVVLANGERLKRDDNYLRESILDPASKVVAGYQPLMPSYQGQLSEEQMLALVSYLKQIEQEPAQAEPETADAAVVTTTPAEG